MDKQSDTPLSGRRHRGLSYSFSNEIDDAEGRDREQVDDEVTGGIRTKATSNKDATNEMHVHWDGARDSVFRANTKIHTTFRVIYHYVKCDARFSDQVFFGLGNPLD